MDIFAYAKEIRDTLYKAAGVNAATNSICQIAEYVLKHRWKHKSFPENEEPVLIIVERSYPGSEPHRSVLRAFFEDGNMKECESNFGWDLDSFEIDSDGDYLIPRGWFEITDYCEEMAEITDPVIGWQPLPDPWIGMEE